MKTMLLVLSLFAVASCADSGFTKVRQYVCDCGPDCTCTTVSDKPGKCGCGRDLVLKKD
ncbi:MAG: hypothetical protein H7A48_01735 [Akkermansiaceae bacterium]|nr:hypothetical protein [Akkermansiaceae bacterium]MCP5546148.1 hypothetical protein [Akkermansiaceae bacterium]